MNNPMNQPKTESTGSIQPADREQYTTEVREKISKIQTKMTAMKEDASRLAGDLKTKAEDNIIKLDAKHKELASKLAEFKYTTDEKWNSDKLAFEKSFQELSSAHKGLFN